VEIRQSLAKQNPNAFEPGLVASLDTLSSVYLALGRLEGAQGAAERMVMILERLAKQNRDAFEPRLAVCFWAMGTMYLEGNPSQAANAFRRGVETLRRLFLLHPDVYARQMIPLRRDYEQSCKSSRQEPDLDLLGPIDKVLQSPPNLAV